MSAHSNWNAKQFAWFSLLPRQMGDTVIAKMMSALGLDTACQYSLENSMHFQRQSVWVLSGADGQVYVGQRLCSSDTFSVERAGAYVSFV